MDVALKEWDVQCQALELGRTALLLRKGGISEQRFGLEPEKFWLYPTFLHQNTAELRQDFHDLLRQNPEVGSVVLSSFAVVEKIWKLEDLVLIEKLEPKNALTADALRRKFKYRNQPFVHALLLRVYTCQPIRLLETPAYAGCVSWVNLEVSLEPTAIKPVLSDQEFLGFKSQLEAML